MEGHSNFNFRRNLNLRFSPIDLYIRNVSCRVVLPSLPICILNFSFLKYFRVISITHTVYQLTKFSQIIIAETKCRSLRNVALTRRRSNGRIAMSAQRFLKTARRKSSTMSVAACNSKMFRFSNRSKCRDICSQPLHRLRSVCRLSIWLRPAFQLNKIKLSTIEKTKCFSAKF